jgi:hypothetical protein
VIDMMGIIPTAAQLVAAREEIADVEAREGRAHLDSWVARFLAFGVRGGGAGEHPTTEWMALAMVYADMVDRERQPQTRITRARIDWDRIGPTNG